MQLAKQVWLHNFIWAEIKISGKLLRPSALYLLSYFNTVHNAIQNAELIVQKTANYFNGETRKFTLQQSSMFELVFSTAGLQAKLRKSLEASAFNFNHKK